MGANFNKTIHPNFINWLSEKEYDWNITYNKRHRTQDRGRIWLLKHVHDSYYPASLSEDVSYYWDEVINNARGK